MAMLNNQRVYIYAETRFCMLYWGKKNWKPGNNLIVGIHWDIWHVLAL